MHTYRCRRNDGHEENSKNPGLDIGKRKLEPMEESLGFGRNPILLTNVFLQTVHGKLLFLFCEPGCCTRKVGENEKSAKSDDDCYGTLNDEDPSPGSKTLGMV